MPKTIDEGDLKAARSEHAPRHGGQLEDYFAPVYLARTFGGDPGDYMSQVAIGNNDHGLDAFHLDSGTRNLYLYQFKWSSDHRLFNASLRRLIDSGLERVFGDPYADRAQNLFIGQLRSELYEKKLLVERVLIHFVFNGDTEKAEKSVVLDQLREKLESRKYIINQYFGDEHPVDLTFEFRSNETHGKSTTYIKKTHHYEITFAEQIRRDLPGGARLHVGFIRLVDLLALYEGMGHRLFDRNIRFGLGEGAAANQSLRRALESIVLKEADDPGAFAFCHNGVALSVERLVTNSTTAQVTEPRVLNGAQTITTLASFVRERQEHPDFKRNRARLESLEVLAKIIDSADDPFNVRVTIATNKQNKVEAWNLRASEPIQLELEDKFRDELGLFYERQEKAWESYKLSELEDDDFDPGEKPIKTKELAQAFLAVQGETDKMSRLPDVFEDDKSFSRAFRQSYLKAPAERIVLIYKIHRRRRALMDHIKDSKGPSYEFIRGGWNLVWCLLAQAVLNLKNANQFAETFGHSVSMEADYSDQLKKLLISKVVPVIKKTSGASHYQTQLAQGSAAFLRTKAFFDACMNQAENDYGWELRSF